MISYQTCQDGEVKLQCLQANWLYSVIAVYHQPYSFITRFPIRRSGVLQANILWQPSGLPCLGIFSTM